MEAGREVDGSSLRRIKFDSNTSEYYRHKIESAVVRLLARAMGYRCLERGQSLF
ncbi:MAG: hypothetical protein IPJ07_20535 [Acidobacteria bacterium]|nr:hypothetical protein [Acidobacteriota bacterium]